MRFEDSTDELSENSADRDPKSLLPAVRKLWSEALSVKYVAENDNFLLLGGDSLAAVRVIFSVRQHLGIDVDLETLLDSEDVSAFCRVLVGLNGVDER